MNTTKEQPEPREPMEPLEPLRKPEPPQAPEKPMKPHVDGIAGAAPRSKSTSRKTYDVNGDFWAAAVKIVARWEGWVPKKYRDQLGIWTIGYGFNLESKTFPKEDVQRWIKNGITREEGDKLLLDHLKHLDKTLSAKHPWYNKLTPVRRMVILDMAFNMGPGWVNKWKNTVALIKAGNYEQAARVILNTKYASQVKRRAKANAVALIEDIYYADI